MAALLAACCLTVPPARAQDQAGAGRAVVETECGACHTLEPDDLARGPFLGGVVGRKSAARADFEYSPAMAAAGKTWDPATLDIYLANPQALVPGTKMTFAGLPDAAQRQAVIAFLATLK